MALFTISNPFALPASKFLALNPIINRGNRPSAKCLVSMNWHCPETNVRRKSRDQPQESEQGSRRGLAHPHSLSPAPRTGPRAHGAGLVPQSDPSLTRNQQAPGPKGLRGVALPPHSPRARAQGGSGKVLPPPPPPCLDQQVKRGSGFGMLLAASANGRTQELPAPLRQAPQAPHQAARFLPPLLRSVGPAPGAAPGLSARKGHCQPGYSTPVQCGAP